MTCVIMLCYVMLCHLAGVRAAVRGGAVHEADRVHRAVTQGLRGHRHVAEGALRLHQTQVRKQVTRWLQLGYDSPSSRPRYDHSTTYVIGLPVCGLLYCGLNKYINRSA